MTRGKCGVRRKKIKEKAFVPGRIHLTISYCRVSVPLDDLGESRPTELCFRIGIKADGENKDPEFNISITR